MRARVLLTMLLALCAIGCGGPDDPPWTIPVPEDTRVVEYPAVSAERRTETIGLVEEMVIGDDGDDSTYAFHRPRDVAADDAGRVHVADLREGQVHVFDPSGNYLRSLGRRGEGPGELQAAVSVALAGSDIVVADVDALSFWGEDGGHLGEVVIGGGMPEKLFGLDDGSVVGYGSGVDDEGTQVVVSRRWGRDGQVIVRYPDLDYPSPLEFRGQFGEGRVGATAGKSEPTLGVDRTGNVYMTEADEYQVLALAADGSVRWALRVAYPRSEIPRAEVDRATEIVRKRHPDAEEGWIDWPEAAYALSGLWVDGHGHVYVFPREVPGMEPEMRPVDVYSAEGERLFAGLIPSSVELWNATFRTHGEFVYDIRSDAKTGEYRVVRYRLVEPF